jgi:hypothetical protein
LSWSVSSGPGGAPKISEGEEEVNPQLPPFLLGPNPVPPVDPADLRRVWELQEGFQAIHTGEQIVVDRRGACDPGTDLQAVGFRLGVLGLMRKIHAWPPNTRLPDALFKALAIIPMTGMAPGVPQQNLPFDLDELLRLVQE